PTVATTQADLIPDVIDDLIDENEQAASAFEAEALPPAPAEPIALEPPPQTLPEEPVESAALPESDIEDFLQEEPQNISAPEPSQPAAQPPAPTPQPAPEFSTRPIEPTPPGAARLAPNAPKPRWITTPVPETARGFTPKVVTIKR